MYQYKKEQVLEPVFLTKLIEKFKAEYVPRFQKDQAYYEVKTEVLKRACKDGKPNNKLAHGFCRYISNMATSYFAGKPLRYQTEDQEYGDALGEVFKDNYMDALNFEVSKEASKKGVGFLLLFSNESASLRIKKMDAESIIPVYSGSLDEFLEAAVRIWEVYDLEGNLEASYADVYDDTCIYHYRRRAGEMFYALAGQEAHLMGDIPVIVVWNNEEQLGDFEPHMSLNDAYDNAQSDTANDMDYFNDAYLCISGASDMVENGMSGEDEGDEENRSVMRTLRRDRVLFLDEHGQAQWLIKQVNDAANENYKSRLYKDIFFLSQVPALSDESFAGNLSGIAIKYKLIGLEELAIMKENRFRSAQTKMLRIITEWLNTKMNKSWDAGSVEQKYERNFIENVSDVINDVKNLEGIISRQTQMDMLPVSVVKDTAEELERIRQEELDAENLPKVDLGVLQAAGGAYGREQELLEETA